MLSTETGITQAKLVSYVEKHLSRCRFGKDKLTCKKCPVEGYRPDYREKKRKILSCSGSRILYHRSFLSLSHLLRGCKPVPTECGDVLKATATIKEAYRN